MIKYLSFFLVALLCAFTIHAQVCFKPSVLWTVPNNNNILQIANADLNKDGNADLVVAENNFLYVWAGLGNGVFASAIYDSISLTQSIDKIATADFNNDGYEDIVGTTYTNQIRIWFGDSLLSLVDSTILPGIPKELVEVGDFNKDGNMDFITNDNYGASTSTGNLITLYSGNGNGSFTPSVINVGNSVIVLNDFKAADFNNDGYSDIAVYEDGAIAFPYISRLTILMNDTLGSFIKTVYTSPEIHGKFAVGDLNNDGLTDIVATGVETVNSNYVNGVITFMNNGAGFSSNFMALDIFPQTVALADFDGDGFLDIATRTTAFMGELIADIAFNTGNGVFNKVYNYYTESSIPVGGPGIGPFNCADYNGDGIPDLGLINYTTSNNVAIKFGSRSINTISSGFSNLSCANSGDGSIYFQASGSGSPFTYLWNSGQTIDSLTHLPASVFICTVTATDGCKASIIKTLTEPAPIVLQSYNTNLSCSGTSTNLNSIINSSGGIPPYEYNFDNSNWTSNNQINNLTSGLHNVVVRDSSNCKDSISYNVSIPAGLGLTQEYFSNHKAPLESVWADFNNDGFKDVATVYNDSNIVYVFLNNSGTGFSPALKYTYAPGTVVFSSKIELHAADVTGDNKLDLFIGTNKIYLCTGDGLGSFVSTSIVVPTAAAAIALGDFDNDLKTDFLMSINSNQQIRFYKGNGLGSFTLGNIITVSQLNPYSIRNMESFDVNNDGNLDLLISGTKFMVLNGNGTGGFAAPAIYLGTGAGIKPIIMKDINYDGYQDAIITGNIFVQFFLGNSLGTYTLFKSVSVSKSINAVGIGDVNNDNVMDVVTANYSGIEINILGSQIYSPTYINEPYNAKALFVEDYNNDGNMDILDQLSDSIYLKIYQNCLPLGINNKVNAESISIYPNPTDSKVNISLPKQSTLKSLVQVYDINGRLLVEDRFSEMITLNIETFSTGFYTVVVSNSLNTYRSKLVKTN